MFSRWAQPPKAVSARPFRQTTSGAHGSAGRADCLPRGKPFDAPAGASPCTIGTPTPRRGCRGERREAGIQWIQPPKAVSAPEFRQTTSGTHGSAHRADCLPRGKPPCIASIGDNFAARNSPWWGLTRRLRRERRACNLHGVLIYFGGDPKGCRGRAESPLLASTRDNFAARNSLLIGPDAPTPAREKGLQPYGALTLFFRWRKKSVQKKASGTATPGKRLLLPILAAGLAMSRAAELASLRLQSCALGARLFPPSKWAGLFPSAAYRRSAPPQLAVGRLTP